MESNTDVVVTERLVSAEERKFMAGDLSADAYIGAAFQEVRHDVWREAAYNWPQLRTAMLLFAAAGSGVYVITSIVFLFAQRNTAALASLAISVGFMVTACFGVMFRILLRPRRESGDEQVAERP